MSMKNAKGLTDFSLLRLFEILFFFYPNITLYLQLCKEFENREYCKKAEQK